MLIREGALRRIVRRMLRELDEAWKPGDWQMSRNREMQNAVEWYTEDCHRWERDARWVLSWSMGPDYSPMWESPRRDDLFPGWEPEDFEELHEKVTEHMKQHGVKLDK
jgi:hypothetical protein